MTERKPHLYTHESSAGVFTSKTTSLLEGEFVLSEWSAAGLNVQTAVKRGVYTVHQSLVVTIIGKLANGDIKQLEQSLRGWLEL